MKKWLFIWFCILSNHFLFAQDEGEDTISAVTIRGVQRAVAIDPITKMQVYEIDSSRIAENGAFSLGELAKTLPSVSIKDYGGLGGLKTVSIRGMGAQFTSVSIDEVPVLPFNSSQIDLSSVPLFYADNLAFSIAQDNIGSAYTQQFGGNLNLNTIGSKMGSIANRVHVEASVGSFGTYGGGVAYQHKNGKHQFSFGGQSNYSDGEFPYTLQNGNLTEEGTRHSSSYFGSQLNGDYLFLDDSLFFHLKLSGNYVDQELPGPARLYQDYIGQFSESADAAAQYRLLRTYKKVSLEHKSKYQYNYAHYLDTAFLGTSGEYESNFQQHSVYSNIGVVYMPLDWLRVKGNVDVLFQVLEEKGVPGTNPYRFQSNIDIATLFIFGNHQIELGVNFIPVVDMIRGNDGVEEDFLVQPFLSYVFSSENDWINLNVYGKRSNRFPTFAEQYFQYNQNELNPENAWQTGVNLLVQPVSKKRSSLVFAVNPFVNYVEDKIIGYPNQNLFIWTYYNNDEALIFGSDFLADYKYEFLPQWILEVNANYTLQYALNRSDESRPEYNTQLPYVPRHVLNTGITLRYKEFYIGWSGMYYSLRYSNQVIGRIYEIAPAFLNDINLGGSVKIKKTHRIGLSVNLNNLGNVQYQFVKNYPMPGFNFGAKISYSWM